ALDHEASHRLRGLRGRGRGAAELRGLTASGRPGRCSCLDVTVPSVPAAPRPSVAASLFRALRPAQWTKNLVVFAALIFGQRLFDADAALRASIAFLVFCGLSGVVYLVNDVVDREADRQHPVKRRRPIAAGDLLVSTAL